MAKANMATVTFKNIPSHLENWLLFKICSAKCDKYIYGRFLVNLSTFIHIWLKDYFAIVFLFTMQCLDMAFKSKHDTLKLLNKN